MFIIIISIFKGANANFAKISSNKFLDLHVYFSFTKESRERGLMWKKRLIKSSGMLFLYNRPQIVNIWMHNTFIPLDIIFIDENKKVLSIKVGNPLSKKIISSENKVIAVLEIPKNCSKKLKLNIGDKLDWSFLKYSKKKSYHCLYYEKH